MEIFQLLPLAAAALLVASGQPACAQPAANATGTRQVISPEVGADRKITYRLYAPNIRQVTLTGDFLPGNTRLAKDEASGVWSYTTPTAMPPGIYGYYFSLDGIRFADPGNLFKPAAPATMKHICQP